MTRPQLVGALARALAAGWTFVVLSCGGESLHEPGPEDPPPNAGLILSEPQATPEGSIAFVSLASGAAPGGTGATITNVTADTGLSVRMFGGGFDPTAIRGEDGDTIRVEVEDGSSRPPSFVDVLKRGKPPVVVRAGPARGAAEVSLNASIVVIWSTPMRPETINSGTITVLLGEDTLPSTVQLSGDRLQAEVRPSDLRPSREYTLVVSGEVTSTTGKPMASEFRLAFRTVVLPTVTAVAVSAGSESVELGQPVPLAVTVLDSAGNPLEGRGITWSVAGDATVTPQGIGMVRTPGQATFTASVEGVTGRVTITGNPLRFREVVAGDRYTCGVTAVDLGYCWGRNEERQLGTASAPSRLEPAAVFGGIRFQTLAAGSASTCGIARDGAGYCWGATSWMEARPSAPLALWFPFTFSAISMGNRQMCAVDGDGVTICGGHHYEPRELDWDETTAESFYIGPFPYFTAYPLRSLSVGDGHTCGLSQDGIATCWGVNVLGQLGDGTARTTVDIVETGTWVPGLAKVDTDVPFASITAGWNHTCALDGAGNAYCWGDNRNGELGSTRPRDCGEWNQAGPTPNCQARPVPVEMSLVFRSLSLGRSFTCGVTVQQVAYCWGLGSGGQLGTGSRASTNKHQAPAPVAGGLRFESVSAGRDHACGLTVEGLVYCWGSGSSGQLGTGSEADQLVPVEVKLQQVP